MTYYEMNPEREAHLEEIKRRIIADVDEQYRKGQAENGGDLQTKFTLKELVKELRDEATDLAVYAQVLTKMLEDMDE